MGLRLRPLDQQVIVITGASSGIGLVTARVAAERGAAVVLAARNEEALAKAADRIRTKGGRAAHVVCDVGKEEDVRRLAMTAIETFGGFDTWVNNAGVAIFGRVWDVPLADWRRLFDTVYFGAVHGSLTALDHFRERGSAGAIVNVGSFVGDRAAPAQGPYASAKAAVHSFTDVLRMEVEHDKLPVSVSLVHPSRIDTPYNEHAGNYMPMQPVHRGMVYPPEAVANAILWCAAHSKRDMYVGSQAKAAAVFGNMLPRLTDLVMEQVMHAAQQSRSRKAKGMGPSALFEPGAGGKERGVQEPTLMRGISYYTEASKRPFAAVAALGVAGLLIGGALRRPRG